MTITDLYNAAIARFGAPYLQSRFQGAPDRAVALKSVVTAVYQEVIKECQQAEGWPLPGVWPTGSVDPRDGATPIGGQTYDSIWPGILLEHAIGLVNWWTMSGTTGISQDQRLVGQSHEAWFARLGQGKEGLGIGGATDVAPPTFLVTTEGPQSCFVSDEMNGLGWKYRT